MASYLILDLGVDWRKGADWFESVLADYDVASNWGNWVAAAGLTGGRVNHFNILKQSKVACPARIPETCTCVGQCDSAGNALSRTTTRWAITSRPGCLSWAKCRGARCTSRGP